MCIRANFSAVGFEPSPIEFGCPFLFCCNLCCWSFVAALSFPIPYLDWSQNNCCAYIFLFLNLWFSSLVQISLLKCFTRGSVIGCFRNHLSNYQGWRSKTNVLPCNRSCILQSSSCLLSDDDAYLNSRKNVQYHTLCLCRICSVGWAINCLKHV